MAKTYSKSLRRENRAARKSKWSPRGTGTTVLTYPCPSHPCFGGSKGCARVTGKACENGQHLGEQLSLDKTVGSECGDTLKALASDQRLILGVDQGNLAPESLSTGSPTGRTPPHGDGSVYSQAYVKAGKSCGPR